MTNEEKKAVERLDYFEPDDLVEYAMYRDCVETIKNLIEKQSKEIEELKDTRSIFNMGRRSYKYEIEDKIKAKIEYYKKIDNAVGIRVLQSLLKEE